MGDTQEEIIRNLLRRLQMILAYTTLGIEPGYSLNDQQLNVGKALMNYYCVEDTVRNAFRPKLSEQGVVINKGE